MAELPQDPGVRWEALRQSWLAPTPSPSSSPPDSSPPTPADTPRKRDPVFQQRIATLEQMLRASNAGPAAAVNAAASSSSSLSPTPVKAPAPMLAIPAALRRTLNRADTAGDSSGAETAASTAGKGKGREVVEEEEPDGGDVIGGGGGAGGKEEGQPATTQELKKVSEGIFLAFKQNRALKEPLPLSLVTSLLYRSWLLDGTIPTNYVPEPDPPTIPIPRALSFYASSTPTPAPNPAPSLAPPAPAPTSTSTSAFSFLPSLSRGPSLLAALSSRNSNAVTPLPTDSSDSNNVPTAYHTPLSMSTHDTPTSSVGGGEEGEAATGEKEKEGEMLPPSVPQRPTVQSTPSLEGMGACEESGKLKLDMMRGSRWRTENDIASGSDVI